MERGYRSLAAFLAATGMTQAELAAKVGLTQGAISRYVRGASLPRSAAALRLKKVTGVSVDDFARAKAQYDEMAS